MGEDGQQRRNKTGLDLQEHCPLSAHSSLASAGDPGRSAYVPGSVCSRLRLHGLSVDELMILLRRQRRRNVDLHRDAVLGTAVCRADVPIAHLRSSGSRPSFVGRGFDSPLPCGAL
jgi:hypothetical protein